jgi:hypothetical protein
VSAERGPAELLGPLLVRFASMPEARAVGPYDLARIILAALPRMATLPRSLAKAPELTHELAVVAALADLCGRWVASLAHRALFAGVAVDAVAAAAGLDVADLERTWRAWADVQVVVEVAGRAGIERAAYELVASRFADRGGEAGR